MTNPTMALADLAEKGADIDVLRQTVQFMARRLTRPAGFGPSTRAAGSWCGTSIPAVQMPSVLPIPFPMGVAGLSGPLITAGGVVFYSGTLDNDLRAYDVTTGRKLWQSRLPAGGLATPMTYRIHGKQLVVVAAGGHGSFGTRLGDSLVAYELK